MGHIGQPTNNFFAGPAALAGLERFRFDSKGNRDAKIFLGVLNGALHEGKRRDNGQPERYVTGGTPIGIADDRHLLTIAGSRAGKVRSALIPNLLTYPADGSMVIVDPKGELALETASYRAKLRGHQVAVLDPFGLAGELPSRYRRAFNPLRLLIDGDSKLLTSNAALISEALVVPGNAKDLTGTTAPGR